MNSLSSYRAFDPLEQGQVSGMPAEVTSRSHGVQSGFVTEPTLLSLISTHFKEHHSTTKLLMVTRFPRMEYS